MRKYLAALATAAAFLAGLSSAYAGSVPSIPSNPTYSDPAAIVPTLNTLVNQLNGVAGYAPAQNIALGSTGTASGGTPVTLNAQRGVVSFTGVGTLATGAVTTLTMTNSAVAANSQCYAQVQSGGAAGSAPYISTATPTAGSLALILANGGTTSTGAAATFAIAFQCF
jgi:hypothetical protein